MSNFSLKMKILFVCLCLMISSLIFYQQLNDTYAYDFEGNEEYYTDKCKSTSLTKSEIEMCSQYSTYLKNKNSNVQSTISETEALLSDNQISLASSYEKINEIQIKMENLQLEVDYLEASILELETSIVYKDGLIRDRMYEMQSFYNSNVYVDLLFGASSLDEFFSITSGVNELTNYDVELITELEEDKAELEIKQEDLQLRKDELFQLEMNEQALQERLLDSIASYEGDIDALNEELANIGSDASSVDRYINSAKDRIEEEERINQEMNNNSNSSSSSDNSGGSNNNSSGSSDNSSGNTNDYGTGNTGIVNAALSKNGSRYVYGTAGPNTFDCSGFTQWAHKQVGITIPRTASSQFAGGKAVALSDLQPGDLVFYDTYNEGSVGHVGIYIGGGQFIHAGTSSTGVYITNMNLSYWTSRYYGARRYY